MKKLLVALLASFLTGCGTTTDVKITVSKNKKEQVRSEVKEETLSKKTESLALTSSKEIILGNSKNTSPYDLQLITSINNHWSKLLKKFTGTEKGRVDITFKLWPNGEVTDFEALRSTLGSIYILQCERAIREIAPFAPWSSNLKKEYKGKDYRDITMTFHYR